jgi:hypothetical protein
MYIIMSIYEYKYTSLSLQEESNNRALCIIKAKAKRLAKLYIKNYLFKSKKIYNKYQDYYNID